MTVTIVFLPDTRDTYDKQRRHSGSPFVCTVREMVEGGYKHEFVDPPPDELCCLVCALPYREPHLLGCCGKKICEPCIERVRLVGKPCPFCRSQPIMTLLDKELRAKVLDLKVFCLNKSSGCAWLGELRDLQYHVGKKCEFEDEACRYGCGRRFPRRTLTKHESDECPQRPKDVKLESLVHKVEVKLTERIAQLEAKVHQIEETHEVAMEAQRTHFDEVLRKQSEKYERKIAELTQQLKMHEYQLFRPPCCLTMPIYSQHKRMNYCWYSPPFHVCPEEYKMCLGVHAYGFGEGAGTHMSVFVHLMRGEHDDRLEWPFRGRITLQLRNQKMDQSHVETTVDFSDKVSALGYGDRVTEQEYGGGWGNIKFISHSAVESTSKTTQYLHNDCLVFRILRVVVHSK